MKITILGTAAGTQVPSPFCDCQTCMIARERKGKDLRKRCCYLINDDLLVDMGPDLMSACGLYGVDLLNVKHALVTHSHKDHFDTVNLNARKSGYNRWEEKRMMDFVAPPSVMLLLNHQM